MLACAAAAIFPAAARRAPKPAGELVLDAADPVIAVTLAGVPLRLRVDLARQDVIELNPAAAARLPLAWALDTPVEVGRTRLEGHAAIAMLRVGGGAATPVQVAEHGRDCCAGADGAIGPDLLPYAIVRWRRSDAPAPNDTLVLPLDAQSEFGLSAAVPEERGVRLRFALDQPGSGATAAAGAILARRWGGRWDGAQTRIVAAFGVERPARPIAFARPGTLGGFAFASLMVRTADFGGSEALPGDPVEPGDIVVAHRLPRQEAWPAVTLGADRLARCAELVYAANPRTLALRCAFDRR